MKSLKDIVRKVIAHKHLGKEMIGAITLNEIRKFFGTKYKVQNTNNMHRDLELPDEEPIQWYVKFNKIFIKTQDQTLKIEIFKKKQEILTKVNEALAKVGYASKMVEIMLK